MSFVSYAQNNEDIMLWRAIKHIKNGFYVDIGANDPLIDSVTKAFYNRGWKGINVEPIKRHYRKLIKCRPRDININCAISSEVGNLDIWECDDLQGSATLDEEVAQFHEKNGHIGQWYQTPVKRLVDIFTDFFVKSKVNDKQIAIHFLKIDVEGYESNVLYSNDWSKYRPWILIIEATVPNTQLENHQTWENYILSQSYHHVYSDGLNRYYISDEHAELDQHFSYPPNVFDDFITYSESEAVRRSKFYNALTWPTRMLLKILRGRSKP